MKDFKLCVLNLPNPPNHTLIRDAAGGYGIAPPRSRIRLKESGKTYLNLFIPYSAAVARDVNCGYNIIDAQATELSKQEIINSVKKCNPDILFSMLSLPSLHKDKEILNAIKEEMPNILLVCCGTVCRTMAKDVFNNSSIDLISHDFFPYVNSLKHLLIKFSESYNFKELLGYSHIKNNEVISNISLPKEKEFIYYKPHYDNLHLEKYGHFPNSNGKKSLLMPILGSRGCPHSCTYCPYPIGFGKNIIFNDPQSVVDEIEYLYQKSVKYFLFRNQSFTLNKKWSKDVIDGIIQRDLDIEWVCEARVDESSKEILKGMWNSGCRRINYGVETGSPSLIGVAKPGIHLDKIRDVFKITKKIGFWRHAHMIFGLPGENRNTLKLTNKFLKGLDPDGISLNFLTPYPGTVLYEIAKKNNWIVTRNWKYYTSFNVVMLPPGLNYIDLYKSAELIQKQFLLKQANKSTSNGFNATSLRNLLYNYFQSILTSIRYKDRIRQYNKYSNNVEKG